MTDPATLIFAHIGDLHITDADEANHRDLRAIVDTIARDFAGSLDFVYLPGDNADNGTPAQYALVREAIAPLPLPVHVITGDHDMEQGSLEAFYAGLGAAPLPKAVDVKGVRCLFLDISGPGTGGPDFRLGAEQASWLERQLADAAAQGTRCAIFMHTYPADLRGEGETDAINAAFAAREVLLVDMGHTHYNELANDGRTIFAATRSTGQIEEGPVGFAVAAIDKRAVSWRFRLLSDQGPLVAITAPVDKRLAIDPDDPDHLPGPRCEVRASVLWAQPIARCTCTVDGGTAQAMREVAPGRWALTFDLTDNARSVTVEAQDDRGTVGRETIEVARAADLEKARHADGSDADAVATWEERHLLGTQLGPNRNGRKW